MGFTSLAGFKRPVVVFSGGGAKCAFQAGALGRLALEGLDPIAYVGVSGGALNAAAAAQEGPDDLAKFWLAIEGNRSVYRRLGIFRSLWRLVRTGGIADFSPLRRLVRERIDILKIRRSGRRVTVSAANLDTGASLTFTERDTSDLFEAGLLASAAAPGMAEPIDILGGDFADGSICDFAPVKLSFKYDPDLIVIILTKKLDDGAAAIDYPSWLPKGLRRLFRSLGIVVDEAFDSDVRRFRQINRIVAKSPDLPGYKSYSYLIVEPDGDLGSAWDFRPDRIYRRIADVKCSYTINEA